MAQTDLFLKLDGVEGESTDASHRGEIDVESFSWGVSQQGPGSAGGVGVGSLSAQDLSLVKRIDKTTPVLMVACATARRFKTGTLTARKAGGSQTDYLKVVMQDLIVSSHQIGGSAFSDVSPTEQLSLAFTRIEISYREQRPDGSFGGEVRQGYDFAANKST